MRSAILVVVVSLSLCTGFLQAVDPDVACMERQELFPAGFLPEISQGSLMPASGDCAYPKVALVLSGGGARGLAHIPVIEALERLGIPIDMVVGTSMGALVGGLYAAGYSPGDIRRLLEEQDLVSLFLDSPVPRDLHQAVPGDPVPRDNLLSIPFGLDGIGGAPALIGDQRILCLLHDVLSRVAAIKSFDNLVIPFCCVGTDVLTGERIVFNSGSLVDAIRGSISIPVVFAPYPVDGRYVVDGGVVDNMPVQLAKDLGADLVIAVDVNASSHADSIEDLDSVTEMIVQTLSLVVQNTVNSQVASADLLIVPELGSIGILDFFKVSEILDAGRISAWENRTALARVASDIALYRPLQRQDPSRYGSYFLLPDVYVRSIAGYGLTSDTVSTALPWASAIEGKPLDDTRKQILRDRMYELRSRGVYSSVSYIFEPVSSPGPAGYVAGDIRILARAYASKPAALQVGLRFDGSCFQDWANASTKWTFHPLAIASLAFDNVFDSSISLDAALSYGDGLSLTCDLSYSGFVMNEPRLSLGYAVGYLDPFDYSPLPDAVRTLDRKLSFVLSSIVRPPIVGLVFVPSLDVSMIFQEAPEDSVPDEGAYYPFALVPLLRTDVLWTTRATADVDAPGSSVEIDATWGRTSKGNVWGISASLVHALSISDAWSLLMGLDASVSRSAIPASSRASEYGGALGMAGYGTGSLVEEMALVKVLAFRQGAFSFPDVSWMLGATMGIRSPFVWEASETMAVPVFGLLGTPEAGLSAGIAWNTSAGTLLAGISLSTTGKAGLFLEFL